MWIQKRITLKPRPRGFHLITSELLGHIPELGQLQIGVAHFFIQHTSASLGLNENADSSVRHDMEAHFNQFVPEEQRYYQHRFEGADDMPAHIKSLTIGSSVAIPIADGKLLLGVWQGIYLGEHRDAGGPRIVIATLNGE